MGAVLRRRWWAIGLLIGAAIWAALLMPVIGPGKTAATRGIDQLAERVPMASVEASRVAVAAAAILLGLLLGLMLRWLARDREDAATEDMIEMRHVAPGSGNHHAAIVQVSEPVEPARFVPFANAEPIVAQQAVASPAPPDTPAWPRSSRETPVETSPAASDPAIARIEAAVAQLAAHGPAAVGSRLDAIDARMGQLAQQIAELAGLARAAARTPPSPPSPAPAPLRSPADGRSRRSISAAARALRERLGDAPEPF